MNRAEATLHRGAVATILLGVGLAALDLSLASFALPAIAESLHLDPGTSVWVITMTQLVSVTLLLPLAALGESLSYRRVYLIGAAFLMVGAIGAGIADTLAMLLLARAVQGMGFAGVMSVNSALIRLTYPKEQLARGIALNTAVIAICSVAGPFVAGALLSTGSWRWLFLLNVPLVAAMIVVGWKSLPKNQAPEGPSGITALDVFLNGCLFVLLFLGVDFLRLSSRASSRGDGMTGTLLLLICVPVCWIYVRLQLGRARPLLPVDLLRIRVFRLSMATSIFGFASQIIGFIALPFMLIESQGRTPAEVGALMTAWPIAVIPAALLAPRLARKYKDGIVSAAGLALLACGLLSALLVFDWSSVALACSLAVCGAGFGFFQSPNNHAIIMCTPPARAGATGGMIGTARTLGHSLGAACVALVFDLASSAEGSHSYIALLVSAVLALVAAGFSILRSRPA